MKVDIRWMAQKVDLDTVVEIERSVFRFAWTREDFCAALYERTVVGMVAEEKASVLGYFMFDAETTRSLLLNFAVDANHQRKGIGSQMIEKLKRRGKPIYCDVRETNLPMQLFLRSHGFTCVQIIREEYCDTDEDAYRFVWEVE